MEQVKNLKRKVAAHKKEILTTAHDAFTGKLPPEGNGVATAAVTFRDVLYGVVIGGAAGAVIGRPSFVTGVIVTGIGHYKKSPLLQMAGIGMMAANTSNLVNAKTVQGTDKTELIKERLSNFKEELKQKIYLDKVLKKKEAVNGMGKVQYFSYPNSGGKSNVQELDMSDLDRIEQHIHQSANDFANNNMQGLGAGGEQWLEDRNY